MAEEVVVEAAVDFAKQFGRWLQVDLGGTDVHVAHIRRQCWQTRIDVLAIPVPGQEPVNRERMTHVMDTGTLATVVHNATLSQEFAVCPMNR